jgi:hypothetical protein
MKCFLGLVTVLWALPATSSIVGGSNAIEEDDEGHHHHHKHHKHKNATTKEESTAKAVPAKAPAVVTAAVQGNSIVEKMKKLEAELSAKAKQQANQVASGQILVNGPLPADFNERFAQAVGHSTGCDASKVHVTGTAPLQDNPDIVEVSFVAPRAVVKDVENSAADPESKLATGNMRPFLIAKSKEDSMNAAAFHAKEAQLSAPQHVVMEAPKDDGMDHLEVTQLKKVDKKDKKVVQPKFSHTQNLDNEEPTPVEEKGIDIDTAMPYGDLEPFGREDTAQELTESSVKESDQMVDQLERAEVAEEKRSVFRALTRLRGAAITSFDGVARSQTGNIDEYNKVHKWRKTHPLHHLADEESDVTKWAFPDNADFIQMPKFEMPTKSSVPMLNFGLLRILD